MVLIGQKQLLIVSKSLCTKLCLNLGQGISYEPNRLIPDKDVQSERGSGRTFEWDNQYYVNGEMLQSSTFDREKLSIQDNNPIQLSSHLNWKIFLIQSRKTE